MSDAYTKLMERVRDLGRFRSIEFLLEWDQETYMPANGMTTRAEAAALVSGLAHERLVADETRDLLAKAEDTADRGDFVIDTNLRETRRTFDRAAKLPTDLVKEIAHTSALAKTAWAKARAQSDFPEFAPLLEKLIQLKKRVAEHIGYDTEPLDVLIDESDPGEKAAEIETLFARLREAIVPLLRKVMESPHQPDGSILTRRFPLDQQKQLSRQVAEALHFDFESGRSDVSVHPFTTTIGDSGDVRITTRYSENNIAEALFGTIHEVGHGLYEQGLPREHRLTPSAEYISLGMHESQSRLWENQIGHSRPFWDYYWDPVRRLFPEALSDVSQDEFYAAINRVTPSLNRVSADELTYNLHIILRFEIERALFTDKLSVNDLPDVWNEKMKQLLGVTPPNDREGCLQDIHWSMGIFGYFQSYALGNLYAAQLLEQVRKDLPDLDARIAANDHRPLLDWLRKHIHRHGRRYRANELIERITGKPVTIEPFMEYVTAKFSQIYRL